MVEIFGSFYKGEIYPFKGQLEIWYQNNKSFILDMKLIFLTSLGNFFTYFKTL